MHQDVHQVPDLSTRKHFSKATEHNPSEDLFYSYQGLVRTEEV